MKKSYALVKVDWSNKERFLKSCQKNKLDIYDTMSKDREWIIKINEEDLPKLKRIWYVEYEVVGYTGFHQLKKQLKKNRVFLICSFIGILFLSFLSQLVLSVEVIHSSSDIRNLVLNALEEKGIKKYSFQKSYQELEQIKKEILDAYENRLEWMEIENSGMKVKVRVEERKLQEETKKKESCHLIAKKDGIIKSISYTAGEALVKRNDYVKKGDILVSGIIHKEDEEKGVVCAKGEVLAEVWYQASLTLPMTYKEKIRTGKKRWNMKIKNNAINDFLFKSRIENFEEESKPLLKIWNTQILFVTQYEIEEEEKKYTEEEAMEKVLQMIDEKFATILNEKEEILSKKVLKKEENNGIMNVEVFVSVKEEISMTQEFQRIKGDENGDAF